MCARLEKAGAHERSGNMNYSYSIEEIRSADRKKIREGTSSLTLMGQAAKELAWLAAKIMTEKNFSEVLFVCGGGNNGGDGFAAAQILYEAGKDASVLCLSEELSPDCAEMKARFQGEIYGRIPRRRFSFLVDCVLGTGLSRAPEGNAKALIEFINSGGAYVLACDLPSGLSENGIAYEPCVIADQTLTIGGMKNALLMAGGADVSGEVALADIGLSLGKGVELWEGCDVRAYFPKRCRNVNKGSFGSAAFLLEHAESSGAVFLSAGACLKSGAGYTKLFVTESVLPQAVGKLPAAVLRNSERVEELYSSDAIAYGMGAGVNEAVYERVKDLLFNYTGVLVLDADALNALSVYGTEILKRKSCRVIVTPHPGEFSRLTRRSVEDVLQNAVKLAQEFASEYNVTVVLKNNRTVITDGERTALNLTGSPALAKGGSGDVLSGFLAGTCARGVEPYAAACVSCFSFGLAGEIAAGKLGEYSPDASDIIESLPKAILSI